MFESEVQAEINADTIQQENSIAINRIRASFIDPGFPASDAENAGIALPSEKLKDGEE
jgi:hypothetical protein